MHERSLFRSLIVVVVIATSGGCGGCFFGGGSYDAGCGAYGDMHAGGGGSGAWFGGAGSSQGGGSTCAVPCSPICCQEGEICNDGDCFQPIDGCVTSRDCLYQYVCDYTTTGEVVHATVVPPSGSGGAGTGGSSTCGTPMAGNCVPPSHEACLLEPATTPAPLLETATWGDPAEPLAAHSVAGAPAVLQLDDDNCDGVIDAYDRPEVLFMTAATGASPLHGVLHAAELREGQFELAWSTPPASPANDPQSAIAAARRDLGAIIATCTEDERVRAYDEAGFERWLGPPSARCDSLALADLYNDGGAAVVTESQILEAETGALLASYGPAYSHGFVVADFDDTNGPILEIVTAHRIYGPDGAILVDSSLADGYAAVAHDVTPLVVAVDPASAELVVWRASQGLAEVVSSYDLHAPFPQACPAGTSGDLASGGPPVVHGLPSAGGWDVGVATARGYVTYRLGAPDPVWSYPRLDCDSPTRGSTAHDFDGDGRAEALVYGPGSLEVLASADGSLLESFCRTGEPGPAHPLVVDLDGDRFGEVLMTRSARLGGDCQGAPLVGLGVVEAQPTAMSPQTGTLSLHSEFPYRPCNIDPDGALWNGGGGVWRWLRSNPSHLLAPGYRLEDMGACIVRVHSVGAYPLAAHSVRLVARSSSEEAQVVLPVTLSPGAALDVHVDILGSLQADLEAVGSAPLLPCPGLDASLFLSCP